MKIDRRCFLSLGIGAAAGTALSPLPWKSMDDSSIWSQNWPWTPVPPDGEATYTNSTCTLCPGGCGISVRKIDNRVVKIEGETDHPVNDGGICALGLSGPQLLYSPTRVQSPMIKEKGKFKKISWDKAISIIVEKLTTLREQGKSNTVAGIAGSSRGTVPGLLRRLLTAYGSPNFMCQASNEDAFALTIQNAQGQKTIPGFDFENSNYILSFGAGIIDGWGSPVRMFQANSIWKNKQFKLVQVDPRQSNTAAKSDKWLPCKPGTEAALALGIAYVILRESLYDQASINLHSKGFEAWRQGVLSTYHPARVAKNTGIDSDTIIAVGREFARATRPIAICGRGEGKIPASLQEISAVQALNVLVGNVNKKGGIFVLPEPDYIKWPETTLDETARRGLEKNRIDGAGSSNQPNTVSFLHRLPKAILSGSQDTINALFIVNANPCYTLSDTKTVIKALKKIPFKVSFSTYMDETAELADLILPNHSYLERYEDVPVTAGLKVPMIGLSQPVVKPLLNTKHTGDVILSIAKAMKGSIAESFPWKSYESFLPAALVQNWNKLKQNGYIELSNGPIQEVSSKFEFQIPEDSLLKGLEGELVLIPSDTIRLSAGVIGSPPFVMKTVPDTVLKDNDTIVQINPKTAGKYGLKQGKYAMLKTSVGTKKVKINLSQGIGEGVISFPRGLGHTAYDKYLAGKGVNFNELLAPVEDPSSGLDIAWGIQASLTKA